MGSEASFVRALLVVVALLLGLVVGEASGLLAAVAGAGLASAFVAGGVAFGGTVSLALLIEKSLGLL